MPHATAGDGVRLYFEAAGRGVPVLFAHEFGGDHRSWEPQVRHLARSRRCIVFAARGYPPSDVPPAQASYSQERAADDAVAVLDAAGADRAHVVGNSMGAFCALHVGLRHPGRVRSLVVAGCGYGTHPRTEAAFRAGCEQLAVAYETEGSRAVAPRYGGGPARLQFQAKDPRGHAEHVRVLADHDPLGAARTLRGVLMTRPSLFGMRPRLAALDLPVLVVAGDEDGDVLDTGIMLKRTIPRAGLAVLPRSGHVTNLEEPALFNLLVERFVEQVEEQGARDPRTPAAAP